MQLDSLYRMTPKNRCETLKSGPLVIRMTMSFSTIRDADTILVMDAGQIVEQGTITSCWLRAVPTSRYTTPSLPHRRPR